MMRNIGYRTLFSAFIARWLAILFILLICWITQTNKSFGQAYQFTQFYASPTFLNPAFAGASACQRLTTNYRTQWPSIPGGYRTYLLSFDHGIQKSNNGLGFLFSRDAAGSGNLRSLSFNGQYSYHLMISRTLMCAAGVEVGYSQRNYDFHKYLFGDQIAYGTTTTVEQPQYDKFSYADLSSGALLYSERSWMGFSARHLNQPNQALVGNDSRLPVLYSVHGGYVRPVARYGDKGKYYSYITFAFNYRAEGKFDQLDIGGYYNLDPIVFGAWYRGIPLFKAYQAGYPNNDALALIVGTIIDRFKFGYSYDITISWLAGHTAGAHEISLTYQFCDPKVNRRKSAIPCPKF